MQGLVIGGIAIGVAAWLLTQSIVAGFRKEYTQSLLEFNADVMVLSSDENKFDLDHKTLSPSVIGTTPFLYREAMLVHQGVLKGVVLKGIDPTSYGTVHRAAIPPNLTTPRTVVLGKALAKQLHIETLPNKVQLLVGAGKIQTLTVVGFFETGLYEYDAQFALMELGSLRSLFGEPNKLTGWELKLTDPQKASAVVAELQNQLSPDLDVTDWEHLNSDIFQALSLERHMFQLLLGLLVGVASLNLIAALLLHLYRHRKQVAVLRALGWPTAKIRLLFTLQGILLGSAGGILGMALAVTLAKLLAATHWIPIDPEIYFVDHLPLDFSFALAGAAVLGTVLLSAATSWRASGGVNAVSIREGLHGPG